MQRLEVSGAVRTIYGSLGVKRLIKDVTQYMEQDISTTVPEKKHALKTYGGVELWLHVFQQSLDGIERYAKHTSRFTREENFPGRHREQIK